MNVAPGRVDEPEPDSVTVEPVSTVRSAPASAVVPPVVLTACQSCHLTTLWMSVHFTASQ